MSINKFKTDYPCNFRIWLMFIFTITFPFMKKNKILLKNGLNAILTKQPALTLEEFLGLLQCFGIAVQYEALVLTWHGVQPLLEEAYDVGV